MTKTRKNDNRKRAIQRIHIARQQLGQSEEEYREILHGQTGKRSCTGMTLAELFQVESYMKKLGFKPVQRKNRKRNSPASRHKAPNKKTQVDLLRALWIEMHQEGIVKDGSENALEQWVQRMSARYNHGRGVEKVDWLLQIPDVLHPVVEALKQWQRREWRKTGRAAHE